MNEQNPEVLQAEIARLQQQLEDARALQGSDASAPYERAEVHQALSEQFSGESSGPEGAAVPPPAAASSDDDALPSDVANQVQVLVNVAFTQGVASAISKARATGNPALVDALHDTLADRMHEELLKRDKINPAP
jgi:hypothetical protein